MLKPLYGPTPVHGAGGSVGVGSAVCPGAGVGCAHALLVSVTVTAEPTATVPLAEPPLTAQPPGTSTTELICWSAGGAENVTLLVYCDWLHVPA
jgi:hypothetical protein